MEASVIWSALTAAVLGGVPTLSTHFLAFSTQVADLTDRVDDPLSLLLEVRVGGGTHIAAALAHARSLVSVPSRTLVVVVSDFEEGYPLGGLLGEVRALAASGVHLMGCAALDDTGTPRYSVPVAQQLVAAGMPVAALSPSPSPAGSATASAEKPDDTCPHDHSAPPVAPEVVAAAVEALTSRLRKKLDAAVEQYAALPVTAAADGTGCTVRCGEDAEVTLTPGPGGAVTDAAQAVCSCLLAPRCLHRAAVLGACPIADTDAVAHGDGDGLPEDAGSSDTAPGGLTPADGPPGEGDPAPGAAADGAPATVTRTATTPVAATPTAVTPTAAQVLAAAALRSAAAAVLAAGVPAAGAVLQADLLRAAHTARLADLHRAEAAALRVVRGLRSARARHAGHRLADLVAALRDLLLTTFATGGDEVDAALLGGARRAYRPGGSLRVHGVCREPVLTATGYGGVVTHLVTEDGRWFSVADVKPGGPARARGAGTAPVAVGSAPIDHARLSRSGLLVSGATVSADGRLGAGRGVRANPVAGLDWSSGPLARLFARPLAEAAAERLADGPLADPEHTGRVRGLVGCDLMVLGAAADCVTAREAGPDGSATGPVIRLRAALGHPDLAHTGNLAQLAAHPGVLVRVLGRVDPDRAATLRPLAVGPVPGAERTLRLPADWQGRADLGYDRLRGEHFPPGGGPVPGTAPDGSAAEGPDPLTDSPLWRVRTLVELAVAGGRRAAAESARSGDPRAAAAALRRTGFRTAAELTSALVAEADRRGRDAFGRLDDPDPEAYAASWLAVALHLTAAERELVRATWGAGAGAADPS
ncbi:SWIM zinc finger family protein [Kitasatospora paranensis]